MRPSRLCEIMAVATLVALALSTWQGCGFSGSGGGASEKTLRINNMAEPATLDPALQSVVEDQRITLALFEGLLVHDPETLAPRPGVAERHEVSSDGRTHTFHLRDCRFSNGEPVTANDFVYSWRRVITPKSKGEGADAGQTYFIASSYADLLFVIDGAEAWYRGTSNDFSTVGIRAHGARTLEVTLVRPTPWFEELLCFATFAPVHRESVERHREAWTRKENFVGNGPFTLDDRRLGESVTVRRSETYWDRAAVHLDRIVYFSTDQIDVALDQYLAGESDWVFQFNPKKARAWLADPVLAEAMQVDDYLGTYFYRFNVEDPALRDRRVRRALVLATDRAAICRHITGLGEAPAEGLVPPSISRFVPWEALEGDGLGFDPRRARDELESAGHAGGAGLGPITIAFSSDVKNKAIAEAVQAMWRQHLGIDVRLENREKRVHITEERAGHYQVSRGSWIGDYGDPTTFLDVFRSKSGNNRTRWRSAEYDELLDRAADEREPALRSLLLRAAERILVVDDPAILPIYYYKSAGVLRPRAFTGIHPNPRDVHPPKSIERLDLR